MAIPSKQIGWSNESVLLWHLGKEIERLTNVTATVSTEVTVINNSLDPIPVTVENIVSVRNIDTSFAYKYISLASTNSTLIKDQESKLLLVSAIGLTSSVRYLKFYDKATLPVVGTDVPLMTIPVPANTQGAGIVIPFNIPILFNDGFAFAITSGSADNDAGAVGAGDVIINLSYQ